MTTYKITIKDNSIPEHMQRAIPNYYNEYTAIISQDSFNDFLNDIVNYIDHMATELDTDPESLEILSIIKQ